MLPPERFGPVADGEADDGRVAGSGQRYPQESHFSRDADGLRTAGAQLPGEPVPVRFYLGFSSRSVSS